MATMTIGDDMLNETELLPSQGRGDISLTLENAALFAVSDSHTESGTELLPATAALTPKQLGFARAYCQHGNAARAYRECYDVAGMSPNTIKRHAYRLVHTPDVADAVRAMQAAAAEATVVDLRSRIVALHTLATADASEITRVVTMACRHCHGAEHRYQWASVHEFAEAAQEAEALIAQGLTNTKRPDPHGGFGYAPTLQPVETCHKCSGLGITRVVLTPSDEWSPAARLLFKSARQKSDGSIEVEMESRQAASEQLARLSGWNVERSESRNLNLSLTADLALANDMDGLLAAYKRGPQR
jgi:phage terminase small subunit